MGVEPRKLENEEEIFEEIVQLYNEGKIDKADGGVAIPTIAASLDRTFESIRCTTKRLCREGYIQEVQGVGPRGQRVSYIPDSEI